MKKLFPFIFCLLLSLGTYASGETKFVISIMDFSNSWTSKMQYHFDNDEMYIEEIDNVDENSTTKLVHRQLLGKEKDLIVQYLKIMSAIKFEDEYKSQMGGDRNQKRISISVDDEATKSIFISNTYQQDLAAFITFLNSFIADKYKMKEFVDPNKPKEKVSK